MVLLMGIVHLMIPFISSLWGLAVVFFLLGFGGGAFETGSMTMISTLWGTESLPFRQATFLVAGFGIAVGPLIVQPFLMHEDVQSTNSSIVNQTDVTYHPEKVNLFWPFAVISFVYAFAAIMLFFMWKLFPETTDHPSRVKEAEKNDPTRKRDSDPSPPFLPHPSSEVAPATRMAALWKVCIVTLAAAFVCMTYCIDTCLGSFIATFATKSSLQLAPEAGAQLTSLYSAAATATRVAGLLYINWIGMEINFLISVCLVIASNAVLLVFCNSSETMLFVGIAMMGISTANNNPCTYGYLETLFPITSTIASVIGVTSTLAYFVPTLIVPHYIVTNPVFLFWFVLICSSCLLISLLSLLAMARIKRKESGNELNNN